MYQRYVEETDAPKYTVCRQFSCSCIYCFRQFNRDRKSLEVTTHPSVTGTVDLLAMITDPKVRFTQLKRSAAHSEEPNVDVISH